MFLKQEFLNILWKELRKDKEDDLKNKIIYLFRNIGCIYRLYPETKIIAPFIREIRRLLEQEISKFALRYLEHKSEP